MILIGEKCWRKRCIRRVRLRGKLQSGKRYELEGGDGVIEKLLVEFDCLVIRSAVLFEGVLFWSGEWELVV